jgi:phosphate-selective porin OprO/OprP
VPAIVAICATWCSSAAAQSPDRPAITLTGYAQAQYERVDDDEHVRDRVLFRRLYLGTRFVLSDDWSGTVLVDFTPSTEGGRPIIRDAYLRYSGWTDNGVTLTVGNQKTPFSQSVLGSSRSRSLVERPFTGERAYGAPGRAIAIGADGRHRQQHLQWAASLASVLHAPGANEIRLDGLADAGDDWNEGVMATGRVEWHPLGAVAREQGDFVRRGFRIVTGVSAYVWTNDGDRNTFTADGAGTSSSNADVDGARGLELSGGVRGRGAALDVAWSLVRGDTIDPGFSGGLYENGRATLRQFGAEGGYMIVPGRLEIVGAIDALAAGARDVTTFRPSIGTAWYLDGHRLKISAQHRETMNARGVRGVRLHATYAQMQFVF